MPKWILRPPNKDGPQRPMANVNAPYGFLPLQSAVGRLANKVRERRHGNRAYFNVNRHLNYSNVCALSCTFCSFYRKAGQAGA